MAKVYHACQAVFFNGLLNELREAADVLGALKVKLNELSFFEDNDLARTKEDAQCLDVSRAQLPSECHDTPVTLQEFMRAYCVQLPDRKMFDRRIASLKNAVESKKVTLPKHIEPWTSGQSHKFLPSELALAWPGLQEYLADLPNLKAACSAASLADQKAPDAPISGQKR